MNVCHARYQLKSIVFISVPDLFIEGLVNNSDGGLSTQKK